MLLGIDDGEDAGVGAGVECLVPWGFGEWAADFVDGFEGGEVGDGDFGGGDADKGACGR